MDFIEMLVGGILQALLSKSEKAQEIIGKTQEGLEKYESKVSGLDDERLVHTWQDSTDIVKKTACLTELKNRGMTAEDFERYKR